MLPLIRSECERCSRASGVQAVRGAGVWWQLTMSGERSEKRSVEPGWLSQAQLWDSQLELMATRVHLRATVLLLCSVTVLLLSVASLYWAGS